MSARSASCFYSRCTECFAVDCGCKCHILKETKFNSERKRKPYDITKNRTL